MNKKVAILTLYGNNNYGNKLQNYALQEYLNEKGVNSSTFKYYNNSFKQKIKRTLFKSCDKKNILDYNRKKFFEEFNKNINYSEKYIDISKINKKILNEFDYILYGSDQVWNYDKKGISKLFGGYYAPQSKNIAFSASFGVSEIPNKMKNSYKNALENFKKISVREDVGKKIVKNITGREDVTVLVDPTMLLDKERWQKVSKKPKNLKSEKFILNYFLGNLSDERKNKINDLAINNGWKVINILDKNDPFYMSGPSEFLYLEQHAKLICTDSFHSCVFAILMNTPFMVFNREDNCVSMNSRLETLLSKFDLEDRYYKGELNESHLKCDYTNAYKILEDERKKANEFLNKALDIE